jgi:hypothetical protein
MSWVAAAIGGAALIGAGTAVYTSEQQAGAIGGAAAAQTTAAQDFAFWSQWQRVQNMNAINDAVTRGLISIEEGNTQADRLLAPLADMGALDRFTGLIDRGPGELSPSETREFNRGIEAMQAGFSTTSGGGVSSRALENAQIFGQDFAAKRLDAQLNRLIPLINIAVGAQTRRADIAAGEGVQEANLRFSGAQALSGLGSSPIAQAASDIGNIQANQITQQQNVQTDLLSNLTGIGSNVADLFIQNPNLFSRRLNTNQPPPSTPALPATTSMAPNVSGF